MNRSSLAKLGAISHVSCIDRRVASQPADDASRSSYPQLVGYGLGQLQGLCALLGARPVRVMARCDAQTSEIFLQLEGGLQVQYYGALGASHDEQSLWVEGPRGSLRACGALLWWRKRGWPKFLPWGLRFGSGLPAGQQGDQALLNAVIRSHTEGKAVMLAS